MLIFNPERVFALRGIAGKVGYLVRQGLSYPLARRLIEGDGLSVRFKNVELLCVLLNCTPNDLFEWRPTEKDQVGENHALNQLKRAALSPDLQQLIKDIPADKFEEVAALLQEMKK